MTEEYRIWPFLKCVWAMGTAVVIQAVYLTDDGFPCSERIQQVIIDFAP
jgi:hypothetical protein